MLEFEQARAAVLAQATMLEPEIVELEAAAGRVLAQDVAADADVPAFDNSAMDGYALRAADSGAGAVLRIVDESRAGHPARAAVGPGEACAISTGAAMPAGADAVIRVEDTVRDGDRVELAEAVRPGDDVRHAGDDVRAGAVVLRAGSTIGAAELGVLASVGATTLLAGRRPRVAVLTTGDELIGAGEPMRPGAVRNSGAHVMPALIAAAGGVAASVTHVRDEPDATRTAIGAALGAADAVVITGGMSVGVHDHVGEALAQLGVEVHFDSVALRPGKPASFGSRGPKLVFGLPGNPVSSFVCFVLFARPALLAMAGASQERVRARAALAEPCQRLRTRLQAVRCRLELRDEGWIAHATGPQSSHILTSMVGADALALIEAGEGTAPAGERVTVELL